MADAVRLAHARMMCRGFGSVPVSVGASATAPDGQPRRGILRVPERLVDDGAGMLLERQATLRVPAADVESVTRGTALTVDSTAWETREKVPLGDGVVVILELARV